MAKGKIASAFISSLEIVFSALAFFREVKDQVVHVHIKDCHYPEEGEKEPVYTMPGEGSAQLTEILSELKASGFDGGIAIEPHVATVFHVAEGEAPDWDQCYQSYVEYGKQTDALLSSLGWEAQPA